MPELFLPFQFLTTSLGYLDPGSGSFILQILIATLLGGLFVAKTFWRRIVDFFRSLFSRRDGGREE